jgi:hypothetical protein
LPALAEQLANKVHKASRVKQAQPALKVIRASPAQLAQPARRDCAVFPATQALLVWLARLAQPAFRV